MEPQARTEIPAVPHAGRIAAVVVGLVVLAVGAVAVFVTDNELGATAPVAAGVAIAGLAVFAHRIRSVEAGGVRVELERQAHGVRQPARRARAAGDVEQAEELEGRAQNLMAAASLVGSRYERLRADEPAGWDRTSRMEGILRDARALDTEGLSAADVQRILETGTGGNRIAAELGERSSDRRTLARRLLDELRH